MSEYEPSPEVLTVALLILRYLLENPEAKDSIEGARNWWLPPHYRERAQEEIEGAIALLIGKGFLCHRRTATSADVYWLNRAAYRQIEAFLKTSCQSRRKDD